MDRERGTPCPIGSHPRVGAARRDGPAPIDGGAPRRTRPDRSTRRAPAAVAALVGLACLVGLVEATGVCLPLTPAGAATSRTAVPAAAGAATALQLASQSSWVAPGQSFDLSVRPSAGTVPVTQLGLSITVYSCLTSVSGFDQSVSSASPTGPVISATRTPLPLTDLTAAGDGTYSLAVPVVTGSGSSSAGSFTIGLAPSGRQCGSPSGVYPVRVALVDTADSQTLGGFTTHLIFTEAASGTQRLRFALVLPVATPISPAGDPTSSQLLAHPSAALAPVTDTVVVALSQTVDRVAAHPGVPLTLATTPQTVVALRASGSTGAAAVAQLGDLATATPVRDQFTWAPYVPVNATALVATGLTTELDLQVSRGAQILADLIDHTTAPQGAATGQLGPWVSDDPVTAAAVDQVQAAGYDQLVLPATSVAGAPTNGSATAPFLLSTGRGAPMAAVVSDADVDQRFVGSAGDPVLAAHQLVAELAQIYYEKPNDDTARAVVAVPPASWTDDPVFVEALLGALTANPIIEPETVGTLLTTVPAAPCRGTCRATAAPGSTGLPVAAIRAQRQRLTSFSTAAPAAGPVATELGDLILSGESELVRPDQQARVVHNAGHALDAQLGQFAVSGDRAITLTSQQGTLPVDIESTARYPATASLTVTSDKLLFPNGATQWTRPGSVQIRPGTNIIDVPVTARSSGQFTVDVTLRSTDGSLVVSEGVISVRSTATSVVGVVLSLGALLVLAVWWFRTSRKRRAARRRDEAGPTVTGEQG